MKDRIRPLTIAETKSSFNACKCGRKASHKTRWTTTFFGSRKYRYVAGKSNDRELTNTDIVCPECAARFASNRGLSVPQAPISDPAPGQRWKHIETETEVTVVEITAENKAYGPVVHFEPGVIFYRDTVDCSPLHGFLEKFDPILE